LETVFELDGCKLKSENEIAEVSSRDSRRTLGDCKLLRWKEIWLGGRDSNSEQGLFLTW